MSRRLRALAALTAGLLVAPVMGACGDEVVADPCATVQCIDGPAPHCEGGVKVSFRAFGECVADHGLARCDYTELPRQDCASLDKVCQQGRCIEPPVVPCEGITCFEPPAPDCAEDVAQVYASQGSCDPSRPPAGQCVYAVSATLDCAASGKRCRAGGCIDPADFPCDPNPCDVPPLGTCAGASPVTFSAAGTCEAVDGAAECSYPQQAANPCPGGTCYAGACATGLAAPAAAGDLVVTEIMRNPVAEDDLGEWIEVYNPGSVARPLDGCTLRDDGTDAYVIPDDAALIVPAGGRVVLGRSAAVADTGGLRVDHVYTDFVLANSADEVIIECGGVTIDRVAYTATGWPFSLGAAMSLRPDQATAARNDNPSNWCDAPSAYGDQTLRGSPRRPNPACP